MPEPRTHAPAVGPRLEIVISESGHDASLADFFRRTWSPGATADSVRAARESAARRNRTEPGHPPPSWIAQRGGQVLGYVTTIPTQLWDGNRVRPAYWIKGLMVLPEFRNGPIGHALLKAAASRLSLSGGLAVAAPARRLFGAVGYTDLGAIENLVRPIAPARILARLAEAGPDDPAPPGLASLLRPLARAPLVPSLMGGALAAGIRILTVGQGLRSRAFTMAVGSPPSTAELDDLWGRFRESIRVGVVRDAEYLQVRYPHGGGSPYIWLAARRDGRLAGVAILRRPGSEPHPRLRGLHVPVLVDLMDDPALPHAATALLAAATAASEEEGADAILTSASSPRLRRLLRRQCYLPLGGNVHLLFRDVSGEGAMAGPLDQWWLTRGDGNADDAF